MKNLLKAVFKLLVFVWILTTVLSIDVPELFAGANFQEEKPQETRLSEQTPSSVPEVIEVIDPSRPNYNLGNCATLCSDVQVLAFFLDDQEGRWTPEEAEAFSQSTILPGLEFLQEQARRYGITISLKVAPFYTNESRTLSFDGVFGKNFLKDDSGNIQQGQPLSWEDRTVMDTIRRRMGFDSLDLMNESLRQSFGCEQLCYLIVPKKAGASYSLIDQEANGVCGTEHAVIYALDEYGNPAVSSTVSRQLLYLFGAGYATESWEGREPTRSVAARMYPYCVMFGGNETYRVVDPYTAYAVGWLNTIPTENDQPDLSNGTPQPGDPYRSNFDKGTCRNLSGRVFLLTVFLDDYATQWTQEEIKQFYQDRINPSLQFLTDQARQKNIVLEFDSGYYATDSSSGRVVQYQGVLDEDGYKQHFPDILDQIAMSLGFRSKLDLHNDILAKSGADQLIIMIALDSKGRSYAVPDSDDNPNHNVEYFVVYNNHWKLSGKTPASTVAHEMLHLFGAEDMYQEPDSTKRAQRAAIAKSHFPKDIMYIEYTDIRQNTIAAYTSYAIGWSDTVPPACTSSAFWE